MQKATFAYSLANGSNLILIGAWAWIQSGSGLAV